MMFFKRKQTGPALVKMRMLKQDGTEDVRVIPERSLRQLANRALERSDVFAVIGTPVGRA